MWHAYKYCVVQVCRRLHSVLWYAIRGTLADGQHVPTAPPLRSYELALAALLQLPLPLRQRCAQMRAQWEQLRDHDVLCLQTVGAHAGAPQEVGYPCNAAHNRHVP